MRSYRVSPSVLLEKNRLTKLIPRVKRGSTVHQRKLDLVKESQKRIEMLELQKLLITVSKTFYKELNPNRLQINITRKSIRKNLSYNVLTMI